MERYNDLEEQLQVALKSAQQQQKQLVSRESEVQFFPCTCTYIMYSIYVILVATLLYIELTVINSSMVHVHTYMYMFM